MVTDSDIDRFFDLLNEQAKRTFKDLDQDELAALPNIFTQFATKTGGDPAYVQESLIGCLKVLIGLLRRGRRRTSTLSLQYSVCGAKYLH